MAEKTVFGSKHLRRYLCPALFKQYLRREDKNGPIHSAGHRGRPIIVPRFLIKTGL